MRILFFSHYFPPEGNAPANRTYDNCARWAQAGHDVTVVTCAPNVPDGVVYKGYRNRIWPQCETFDGIHVVRVWTWLAPNAGFLRRTANFLSYMLSATVVSLFLRRPDIIIATSPQFFCGWAGVIASYLKWSPFVLEVRDIWPESIVTVDAMRKGVLFRVLERLERWMYAAATHIVAVGEGYRQSILKKTRCNDQVSVVANGVDTRRFAPRPRSREYLARWELAGSFVCSYTGTIGMAHGLEVVIRAAERLRALGREDICFLLVGDGAERLRLQQQAARAGVERLVRFTGRLDHSEMPRVLASSDICLIHLRNTELFKTVVPSKMFEAMAMEKPILMGVDGIAREIVMDAKAGVAFEPDSDEQLAQAICRLADCPHETRRLARHAREYVLRNYNRDHLAEQYLRVLQAICGHPTQIGPLAALAPWNETADQPQPSDFGCETAEIGGEKNYSKPILVERPAKSRAS